MARSCERPSCRETGDVTFVIDTANLIVTIDAPVPRISYHLNILCRRHADSLVVPRDWTIIDNRTKKQRLFSAPASPKPAKQKSSKTGIDKVMSRKKSMNGASGIVQDLFDFATRVVAPVREQPEIVATHEATYEDDDRNRDLALEPDEVAMVENKTLTAIEDETVTETERDDPQETQAMPWTPQFDRTGDLDGTLRARGRLLSRAFGRFDDAEIDADHDQQHPEY